MWRDNVDLINLEAWIAETFFWQKQTFGMIFSVVNKS
jgi:hypothetical protein